MSKKTITDPLYGYVELTDTEAKLVSSRCFQRLHNVRQLGLAHLVFPNAGYSRFAHSIGACHNAGRMLTAIEHNTDKKLPSETKAAYRIAALLHDVGHYPFSHTTEHAIEAFYIESLLTGSGIDLKGPHVSSLNHEEVGGVILEHDEEISQILKDSSDVDKEALEKIFSKDKLDPLFGIISSDLDCDRLDYMTRTAHLVGVPYGVVDVDFIIGKSTLGHNKELAFDEKSAKAIDHFLVSRYYDYMQIVFHKTVHALEWSMEEAINYALVQDQSYLSEATVIKKIQNSEWCKFDDSSFSDHFKQLLERTEGSAGQNIIADHLAAILHRRPAKRVWHWEAVDLKKNKIVPMIKRVAEDELERIIEEFGIDPKRLCIKERKFPFVKIGSEIASNLSEEETARSVKLVGNDEQNLMVNNKGLLLNSLSNMQNNAVSIYYLPPSGEPKQVRKSIREKLHSKLKDVSL